ncbi:MAG: PEP-CTERM sorting domain-containing protein [Deltaproteobacteria bacterium]|nr:PEP-CTERM sorting domain-containing protein [Deltaproteobacteria bacterium]MBW2388364.1 PEP-CTERM sorting domain-containing protein [Deltaproteobacteria bacterium]MBW2725562.1 PEP-CTERM sorting domain-containing protein [Deltaproteobacteria bacterium]
MRIHTGAQGQRPSGNTRRRRSGPDKTLLNRRASFIYLKWHKDASIQQVNTSLELQDVDPSTIITVPEPSVELLLLFGTAAVAGLGRLRRR